MVGEFNGLEEKQHVLINETQRNTADHFYARIRNDPFGQNKPKYLLTVYSLYTEYISRVLISHLVSVTRMY